MSTQAIAPRSPVMEAIEKSKPQFQGRLPEGMTMERFTYGLATAVQKNPNLLKCEPKSVLLAAYEAAECGCDLSPSRAMGWIIPYGDQAQFQPSYRHFIQLAYKSGCVKSFNAEVVYRKDKFKISFAPERTVNHEPNLDDRGEPVGAYAIVQFLDDHVDFEFLNADQIAVHKNASKMPNSLMWTKFWEEAWRKTAIRVLSKRLPLTNPAMEKLAELVQKDADNDLETTGALELELDSPLAPAKANIPPYVPAAPAPNEVATPIVNFQVAKLFTYITGQTRPIEADLKKLQARRDEEKKAWTIPVAMTESFLVLCDKRGVIANEISEQGIPIPAQEGTMVDLFPNS